MHACKRSFTVFSLFKGKKFQNVAKEGIKFADEGDEHKEQLEQMQKDFEPLTNWLKDNALNTKVHVDHLHH